MGGRQLVGGEEDLSLLGSSASVAYRLEQAVSAMEMEAQWLVPVSPAARQGGVPRQ